MLTIHSGTWAGQLGDGVSFDNLLKFGIAEANISSVRSAYLKAPIPRRMSDTKSNSKELAGHHTPGSQMEKLCYDPVSVNI